MGSIKTVEGKKKRKPVASSSVHEERGKNLNLPLVTLVSQTHTAGGFCPQVNPDA